jgi:hypothetical protein
LVTETRTAAAVPKEDDDAATVAKRMA